MIAKKLLVVLLLDSALALAALHWLTPTAQTLRTFGFVLIAEIVGPFTLLLGAAVDPRLTPSLALLCGTFFICFLPVMWYWRRRTILAFAVGVLVWTLTGAAFTLGLFV